MTQDRRPWLVHGVGGSSRGQLYDSHQTPQPEPTHSWLAQAGPPTITAAAAALLVTDRRRHVPCRTPAPPRKQLSCTSSALARVSYEGMWGCYCSEQRRHLWDIICGSRATRNAELDIKWSGGFGTTAVVATAVQRPPLQLIYIKLCVALHCEFSSIRLYVVFVYVIYVLS